MARLPFVVEPRLKPIVERIGTEESGILEIERRGYLTAGEKNFVQQIQQSDSSAGAIISLARRVARKHAIGLEKAYSIVTDIMTGNAKANDKLSEKIEAEFAEDIQKTLSELTNAQSKTDLVQAACMIINRVDSSFAVEDIVKQHPDLITALAELYREEEAKSIDKLRSKEDAGDGPGELEIEEIEKKQSQEKADG